jgi:hypothetical protein
MNKIFSVLFAAACVLLLPMAHAVAALGEVENAITFRGEQHRIALPPVPVYVAAGAELPEPVLRDLVTLVPAPELATLTLALEPRGKDVAVRISQKGQPPSGAEFVLPADAQKLRRALAGHARLAGLRALEGRGEFPGLKWEIQIYRPCPAGKAGAVSIDEGTWEPAETMTVEGRGSSREYGERALLTFSFANTSRENLYVYVVNSTDEGQVLPVLPLQARSDLQNLATYGQELVHPTLRLELGAPVERVRLIVSRLPLSVAHWAQEGFDADPAEFERPAPALNAEDWMSREVVFTRK